jgi:hypothetical protein
LCRRMCRCRMMMTEAIGLEEMETTKMDRKATRRRWRTMRIEIFSAILGKLTVPYLGRLRVMSLWKTRPPIHRARKGEEMAMRGSVLFDH